MDHEIPRSPTGRQRARQGVAWLTRDSAGARGFSWPLLLVALSFAGWVPEARAFFDPLIVVEQPAGNRLVNNGVAVEFGSVLVGGTSLRIFTIRNDGDWDLNLFGFSITGTAATSFTSGGFGRDWLSPGQSTTLAIDFRPTSTGDKTAFLNIESDSSSDSYFTIPLHGTSVAPEIVVEAAGQNLVDEVTEVNLGSVNFGSSVSRQFTIRNTGSSTLTVSAVQVLGTVTWPYSITGSPTGSIAPGGSKNFTLNFNAGIDGELLNTLRITSDDADEGVFNVPLRVRSVSPVMQVSVSGGRLPPYGTLSNGATKSMQGDFDLIVIEDYATFTVSNSGDASLTLSSVMINDPTGSFSLSSSDPTGAVIAPGGQVQFQIEFRPTVLASVPGSLVIQSNDIRRSPFTVNLDGQTRFPVIGVSVDGELSPVVNLGESSQVTFVVNNSGTYPLVDIRARISGSPDGPFRSLSQPASIGPGNTTSFTVEYRPQQPGTTSVYLSLFSSDPASPVLYYLLEGTCTSTLAATYLTGQEVPLNVSGFNASDLTAQITLGHLPDWGDQFLLVENTGTGFITGQLANLPNGATIELEYDGMRFPFVAWYYGGDGNDLVLLWPDTAITAWGSNTFRALGDPALVNVANAPPSVLVDPSTVLAGRTVVDVVGGNHSSLALCADGTLAAWGAGGFGQLGNGTFSSSPSPVAVDSSTALSGKQVVAIAAGSSHYLALCSDGTVVAWGSNVGGQLGDGSYVNRERPVAVDTSTALLGKTVVRIAAGQNWSLALCSDGTLVAWGFNNNGQLGNNSFTASNLPVLVDTATALGGRVVTAVAAGAYGSLALCSDGTVAQWGMNGLLHPVPVDFTSTLPGWRTTAIAVGNAHCLALGADGSVAAWGANESGQLGNPLAGPSSLLPVRVSAADASSALFGKTVIAISAGARHSLALCSDGTLAGWGANFDFQVDSSGITREVPVSVPSGLATELAGPVTQVAKSVWDHSLAVHATLSPSRDTDLDGMSDVGEFTLRDLGFDWRVPQPSLLGRVTGALNLYSQADLEASRSAGQQDVLASPVSFGLYDSTSIQDLAMGATLLPMDASTGTFTLNLGLEKSADNQNFLPFPVLPDEVFLTPEGEVQFEFTIPDNVFFLRVRGR